MFHFIYYFIFPFLVYGYHLWGWADCLLLDFPFLVSSWFRDYGFASLSHTLFPKRDEKKKTETNYFHPYRPAASFLLFRPCAKLSSSALWLFCAMLTICRRLCLPGAMDRTGL